MIYQAKQLHTKLLTTIMAGVAAIGFATAASAVGGGLGVDANVGAAVQTPAPINGQVGGAVDAQMNTSGSANTNAQSEDSATHGADRAKARMNMKADKKKHAPDTEINGSGKGSVTGQY